MKNIKNNLIGLSQVEVVHVCGGAYKNKIFSVPPIVDIMLDAGLVFWVTQKTLSENSDSIAPVIMPIIVSLVSSCNKDSVGCDNNIHKAVASLASTVAVAAKYFLLYYSPD